jgi:Ca-activated chloride channel family protein
MINKSGAKNSLLLKLFKWLSIILALIALASPITKKSMAVENKNGYSIALLIDASGSMRLGFGRRSYYLPVKKGESKFDIVMNLAKEFIKKRKDDELGLVVFGNFAYVASPLTYDKRLLGEIIDKLKVGIAGSNYTVINDALFQSAKLFTNSKAKTKIAILLTDGQSRGDNVPFEVAMKFLKENGVKVYTIGIGKNGDFDTKHLQKIAKMSGGKFFSAYSKSDLKRVYEKIDRLEKSKIKAKHYIRKRYFYEYPLFFAFLSLLFYGFLLNKRASL